MIHSKIPMGISSRGPQRSAFQHMLRIVFVFGELLLALVGACVGLVAFWYTESSLKEISVALEAENFSVLLLVLIGVLAAAFSVVFRWYRCALFSFVLTMMWYVAISTR